MTKDKKPTELTLDELYAEKKKCKGILIGLGVAMLIACGILVYFVIKSKNYALIGVGCGSFITLLPILARLGQIEKEIKSRNSK